MSHFSKSNHISRSFRTLALLAFVSLGTCVASLATFSSTVRADTIITMGGSDQAVTDDGFDIVSDSSFMTFSNFGASWELIQGLRIGGEYQRSVVEYTSLGSFDSTLDSLGLMATARLEYPWKEYARPYIGVGAGLNFLGMEATIARQDREQDHILPAAYGVGGFEIMIPRAWLRDFLAIQKGSLAENFTMGLSLELGYHWIAAANFDSLEVPEPDKEPEPEDRLLETENISLGEVSLSGMMMRFGFQVHF